MKQSQFTHIMWLASVALGIAVLGILCGQHTLTLGQDKADPFTPPEPADPLHGDDENPLDSEADTKLLAPRYGGSPQRVGWDFLSLQWLAKQQAGNGGWSFAESENPFEDNYSNPGKCPSRSGATGLVLLAFLGAGETHQIGKYKPVVDKGLQYLLRQLEPGRHGANLCGEGDRMVWHGIATLALCEAYAMTRDEDLKKPAQRALDYIAAVQDKRSGGWPACLGGKPSPVASACQILALKSGHMGYLKINPKTVRRAARYFDDEPSGDRTEMVAGLLSRMLMHGETDTPAIRRATRRIVRRGPAEDDVVYNYFAQQILHHRELHASADSQWRAWNGATREQLVNSQIRDGDERGSWWNPRDVRARQGGRLLQTALSTMTLEVYYRHLPIYSSTSAEEGFESPGS